MPVAQDKYSQVQYQQSAAPVLPIPPTIQLGRDPVYPDTTARRVPQNFAAMEAQGMVTPVKPIPPSIVLGWSAVYPDATRRLVPINFAALTATDYVGQVKPIPGPAPGTSAKEQIVYAGVVDPGGASGSVVQT